MRGPRLATAAASAGHAVDRRLAMARRAPRDRGGGCRGAGPTPGVGMVRRARDRAHVVTKKQGWRRCFTKMSFPGCGRRPSPVPSRSEEHTSELQSLMRISYAVFCLKKKKKLQDIYNQR